MVNARIVVYPRAQATVGRPVRGCAPATATAGRRATVPAAGQTFVSGTSEAELCLVYLRHSVANWNPGQVEVRAVWGPFGSRSRQMQWWAFGMYDVLFLLQYATTMLVVFWILYWSISNKYSFSGIHTHTQKIMDLKYQDSSVQRSSTIFGAT